MEIKEWNKKIKSATRSMSESRDHDYKVLTTPEGLKWFIYDPKSLGKCKACGHCRNEPKTIEITFTIPRKHLTIFEVGMLGKLYFEDRLVADYAQFERCQYGEEFIANIVSIKEL